MIKHERKDGWLLEEDNLLAQIILTYIQQKKTQMAAFEEASVQLNRTVSACSFRWNSEVRKRFNNEIRNAKLIKRDLFVNKNIEAHIDDNQELARIIEIFQKYKSKEIQLIQQIRELTEELKQKNAEVATLKNHSEQNRNPMNESYITDDYNTLLQILHRARQLGITEDVDRDKSIFKMDGNGNLERIS